MTEPQTETTPTQSQPDEPEHEDALEAVESDHDEPASFDRDYVQKLRAEAADARTAARDATTRGDALSELLLTRSIERAAGDVLQDVSDLPRDGDYFAEDGTPDLDAIRAAAEALTEAKPHLARVRGEVHQGAKEQEPSASFGELMRAAMR